MIKGGEGGGGIGCSLTGRDQWENCVVHLFLSGCVHCFRLPPNSNIF